MTNDAGRATHGCNVFWQVSNDDTSRSHGRISTDVTSLNHGGTCAKERRITNGDVAGKMSPRSNVCEIANATIMIDAGACIDNGMSTDDRIGLDHSSRHHHGPAPQLGRFVNPSVRMLDSHPLQIDLRGD
jgi:hypothetical protein